LTMASGGDAPPRGCPDLNLCQEIQSDDLDEFDDDLGHVRALNMERPAPSATAANPTSQQLQQQQPDRPVHRGEAAKRSYHDAAASAAPPQFAGPPVLGSHNTGGRVFKVTRPAMAPTKLHTTHPDNSQPPASAEAEAGKEQIDPYAFPADPSPLPPLRKHLKTCQSEGDVKLSQPGGIGQQRCNSLPDPSEKKQQPPAAAADKEKQREDPEAQLQQSRDRQQQQELEAHRKFEGRTAQEIEARFRETGQWHTIPPMPLPADLCHQFFAYRTFPGPSGALQQQHQQQQQQQQLSHHAVRTFPGPASRSASGGGARASDPPPSSRHRHAKSGKKPKRRMSYGSLRVIPKELPGVDPSEPSFFDILSDEIILHIFRYLDRASLASMARSCKRLQAVCYDGTLWARVDFAGKWLEPGVVGAVVSRGTQVLRMAKTHIKSPIFLPALRRSLDSSLSGDPCADIVSSNISCGSLCITSAGCLLPRLQYLDLSNSSIAAETIAELVGACRNLIKLGLENCDVSDQVMTAINGNLGLKTLHLGMARGVTSQGLVNLGINLQSVEELNLGWINLREDMLEPLRNGVLSSNADSLSRLSLAGAKESLDDATVAFIAKKCVNLVELDISDAGALTGEAVNSIIEHANHLVVLSMSRCYKVALGAFVNLNGSPSLKELNAHGMLREQGLVELRKRLSPIDVNVDVFSHIARPTTGIKRTSIWNMKTRQDIAR